MYLPRRRRNPNCLFHPGEALGCSDLALPAILFNNDLAVLIVLCELVSRCFHDHLIASMCCTPISLACPCRFVAMLCHELLINPIPKCRTCSLAISRFLASLITCRIHFSHWLPCSHALQFVIYLPSACLVFPVVAVDSYQRVLCLQSIVYRCSPSRLETRGWKS